MGKIRLSWHFPLRSTDLPRPAATDASTAGGHRYWREVLDLLHQAYNGICAYSCHWIPYDTGNDTVEHFIPKKRHPRYAYEWSNYRLVCGTLNGRKGEHRDVLDPFLIKNGDFILKFPSLMVDPSPNLSTTNQNKILLTIERLGLNDEGTCLKSRVKWVSDYCDDHISSRCLSRSVFAWYFFGQISMVSN
jgi:hypothetical protein